MITETLLLVSLCISYHYNLISFKFILFTIMTYYWLPKTLFIDFGLNYLFPKVITNIKTNNFNSIALTFDDVPYNNNFHKLLSILDTHNVKATFFVISDYVNDNNINLLIKAVKNGHQLGNHGKTNSMHVLRSNYSLVKELLTCDRLIKKIYKEANVELPIKMVYRPGGGFISNRMIKIVNNFKYNVVLGSVYSNDSIVCFSNINYCYLVNNIENNDIVILHDRNWTVSLLERLLPWLIQNNFNMTTLENI